MSNSNYSKVDNTSVSGSALTGSSLKLSLPLANLRVVSGRFFPRAAGVYPLQEVQTTTPGPDNWVELASGDTVLAASMVGVTGVGGGFGAAAGCTLRLGVSAATGGAAIYSLGSAASSFVQVATGVAVCNTAAAATAGNLYPSLTVAAAAVSSGNVDANYLVLNVATAPQA